MRTTTSIATGLLLTMGLFCKTAQAQQVVFDNFGPNNTFLTGTGYAEFGLNNYVTTASQGMSFTPTATGNLSRIDIALQQYVDFGAGTDDAHLTLSNGIPGAQGTDTLENFVITDMPVYNGKNSAYDTITSTLHPLLQAGQTYFLYEQESGNESNVWDLNSLEETGPFLYSTDNINYSTHIDLQGAFRVSVTAVPEPSTYALLFSMGLAGTAFFLRRRKPAPNAA